MTSFFPPIPGPQDPECVFWHDFESLTPGNLWRDQSRNGLHATPQAGFVAPNYGLARTSKGKGYANFTGGANVYATLPLRFYDVAPTDALTFVLAFRHVTTGGFQRFFSCLDAGNTRGITYRYLTNERLYCTTYDAGGVGTTVTDTADVPLTSQTVVSIISLRKSVPFGAAWYNGRQATENVAGSINLNAYDATVVPTIGASLTGGSRIVGDGYFLALFRDWIPNNREAQALTSYLRDGVL